VNDGSAGRQEPAPPPARLQRAGAEVDDDREPVASSPASEPPASVRETMQRTRRYSPGRSPPPARRRRQSPRRGPTPPPARELTDVPVAEIASREVEVGNEVWNILVNGSSRVGSPNAHGVRLPSVGLEAPGDRPNPEGTHYLVAERLEDVDEDVLRGLVTRAVGTHAAGSQPARRGGKRRRRGRFRHRNR